MKAFFLSSIFLVMLGSTPQSIKGDEEAAIKKVISSFAKAGEQHDLKQLDQLLDSNFRIVMNRLFGSSDVMIVDKAVYMEKIKSKEWGGEAKKLSFGELSIVGNTASVTVAFKGQKTSFTSLIHLIQDEDGKWKLVNEIPVM